jgi:hypothetical protein
LQKLIAEPEDRKEFTLGIGKLLGLFFLVALLCALSFAFGYRYGLSSSQSTPPVPASPPAQANIPVKPVVKPPSPEPSTAKCPEGENCQKPGIPSSQDLSFYKSVQKKEAGAPLSPAKPEPKKKPVPKSTQASVKPPAVPPRTPSASQRAKAAPTPSAPPAAQPKPPQSPVLSGVMVQVTALRKREDAERLQQALLRKQYPAVITTAASDQLFHVQVGPFTDLKDAETTRSSLQGEGYSPILKK